jgi:hypothetical protein
MQVCTVTVARRSCYLPAYRYIPCRICKHMSPLQHGIGEMVIRIARPNYTVYRGSRELSTHGSSSSARKMQIRSGAFFFGFRSRIFNFPYSLPIGASSWLPY